MPGKKKNVSSPTKGEEVCVTRNYFVVLSVAIMFVSSYFCAETVFTEKWWRTANIKEVIERFDGYSHFSHFDEDGHTLAMYALKYAQDPNIPMYFILNKTSDLGTIDRSGRTVVDYARQNPVMKEPLQFLLKKRNEEYIDLGGN